MFYRPNFCANCGEKVERPDWGLFTSRRFCPVCESEFKGQDLVPRAIVAAGLIVGMFGIGAYMRSGPVSPAPLAFRPPARNAPVASVTIPSQQSSAAQAPAPAASPPLSAPQQSTTRVNPPSGQVPRYEAAQEDTYICGAETKKGTPCSRRVKGNVRCYQHKGMPAMLSPDKLKVS